MRKSILGGIKYENKKPTKTEKSQKWQLEKKV
jgi:hypothetical protein